MNTEAEVLTCHSSEPEILNLELKSLLTHDLEKPIDNDLKRMEEVACFCDLPTKERLVQVDKNQFVREAKWIAKMMLELPSGVKVYPSKEDLEKTILQLLNKLLEEKLSVV